MKYSKDFKIPDNFYEPQIIMDGLETFSSDFQISFKDGKIIISSDELSDIEEIYGEFMNYLVYLTVNN